MRATAFFLMTLLLAVPVVGCSSSKDAGLETAGTNLSTPERKAVKSDGGAKKGGDVIESVPMPGGSGLSVPESGDGAVFLKTLPAKDAPAKDGKAWTVIGEKSSPEPTSIVPSATPLAGDPKSKAPPAMAEAVVGRDPSTVKKPKDQGPPAGILTAGSFDDNVSPQVFSSYVRRTSQNRGLGDLTTKLLGQRLMVLVKDGAGNPVGDARVKLSAGASAPVELTTRTDGRAIFMLSLDELPVDQSLLATVTGPNGGNPVVETITAGSTRWEITLPATKAQLPKNLDLAIVLDTTGSMGDEIKYLTSEIRFISKSIAKKFPEVKQRFSLILYKDEGDEYVTRTFDFTDSLDEFHKRLSVQKAGGGGDLPEAVHRALEDSMQLRWQTKDTARMMFLVGDAPPHAQHMNRTLAAVNTLRKKGIAIYPLACSGYDEPCEFVMRSSALLTGGQFLFLTDDSGVGGSHAEPTIPYYQVERLERLMVRMISSELSGQHIPANPADIIRSVGKKVN